MDRGGCGPGNPGRVSQLRYGQPTIDGNRLSVDFSYPLEPSRRAAIHPAHPLELLHAEPFRDLYRCP